MKKKLKKKKEKTRDGKTNNHSHPWVLLLAMSGLYLVSGHLRGETFLVFGVWSSLVCLRSLGLPCCSSWGPDVPFRTLFLLSARALGCPSRSSPSWGACSDSSVGFCLPPSDVGFGGPALLGWPPGLLPGGPGGCWGGLPPLRRKKRRKRTVCSAGLLMSGALCGGVACDCPWSVDCCWGQAWLCRGPAQPPSVLCLAKKK
jgi:hypothetical protein